MEKNSNSSLKNSQISTVIPSEKNLAAYGQIPN